MCILHVHTLCEHECCVNVNTFLHAAPPVQRRCGTLSNDKKFLLDMLFSKTTAQVPLSPTAAAPDTEGEGSFLPGERTTLV